jgi:arabinofuranosyltransferase
MAGVTFLPQAARRPPRDRRLAIAILAVLAAAMCAWYARGQLIDDAFISFRYAANLAGGHGLVFNPGDRVEGYTNFLWVLLLSATTWVGFDPEVASRLLGAAFSIATVALIARPLPSEEGRPLWATLLAPALVVSNATWSLWAVHGLETAMFTFLVTLGMRDDARADGTGAVSQRSALAYALATLTRPEGAIFFAAAALFRLAASPRSWRSYAHVRHVFLYLSIVGSHMVWRYTYYGHLLPNTYYAKVGAAPFLDPRGLAYLAAFFLRPHSVIFLLLAPAAWAARRSRSTAFFLWISACYLAGIIAEGGDAFPAFRFIVPICPALYALVQEGAFVASRRLTATRVRRIAAPAAALAGIAAAALHAQAMLLEARRESEGADDFTSGMKLVARTLRDHLPPSSSIALNPAGAIPYGSGLRAYDMLGLTDAHIARTTPERLGTGQPGHEKGDGRYILDRRPDVILMGNVLALDHSPESWSRWRWRVVLRSEEELMRLPDLERLYVVDALPLSGRWCLVFLRRRDFVIRDSLNGAAIGGDSGVASPSS